MSIQLNHTIVWCKDQVKSSTLLAEMLGRPKPTKFAHFDVVDVDNGVSMDFSENGGDFSVQHYAFLVSEEAFDAIFGRIKAKGLDYWADPGRTQPGQVNRNDGGRGVYWLDPDGHVLEAITRPYGSGG